MSTVEGASTSKRNWACDVVQPKIKRRSTYLIYDIFCDLFFVMENHPASLAAEGGPPKHFTSSYREIFDVCIDLFSHGLSVQPDGHN